MKRVILSAIFFFGVGAYASAQSTGSTGTSAGSGASKSSTSKKPSDSLDNRKIYHFKDGQRATPTGAEATPSSTGGGFAAIGKDTTPKVVEPATKDTMKKSVATGKSGAKRKA